MCKPKCDMAGLTPPGTCNDMGQCCQTICQGYSTADLFPDDSQPRCGSLIDPIGMPWCNGALDQQFIFTSETGQIDLTVLRNPDQVSGPRCAVWPPATLTHALEHLLAHVANAHIYSSVQSLR